MNAIRARWSALPSEMWLALKQGRAALTGVLAASFIVNILMLAGPIFMLQVYDRVLPSRSVSTLIGLLLVVVVLFLLQSVVDAIRSRLLTRIAQAFDEGLRERTFQAVQREALIRPGNDGLQLIRDLDTVRGFMAGAGIVAVCDLPWTPVYILVCTIFHPLMGLAVFLGAAALCVITFATELSTRAPTKELINLAASRRSTAEIVFRHAEAVHALGMLHRLTGRWSDKSSAYLDMQAKVADLSSGFGSGSRLLRMALQSGVLALGAYLVINQQATAGVMLAATILSIRALSPIELAIANWRGFIASRESARRLCEAFAGQCPPVQRTTLPAPRQELRVTSLSVTAPQSGVVLLHEISFLLKAGQAVAVVGASGSGKSTLARVLVGAWPAARGVVRIDGSNLHQWDSNQLGPSLGFLPQDVALFKGTVAENISRYAEQENSRALLAAAMAAGVHDMILHLPQGYETEVGDGGAMLSGGQRQRIALARALYGDPFLLVLDEPNSNLDTAGEKALARAILDVRRRGGIVVVIAHRPAILSAVDHVLILNEGRMHAFGKTETLFPSITGPQVAPQVERPEPVSRRRRRVDAAE